MKKILVCAALVLSASIGFAPHARANEMTWKMENVMPKIMAWWLDAARQVEPEEFVAARRIAAETGLSGEKIPQQTMFTLPKGITKITPDDAKLTVSANGTAQALAELTQQIAALDKPLRQVEIEAELIYISEKDARQFDIYFMEQKKPFRLSTLGRVPAPDKSPMVGYVRNNFRAKLSALEASGRAEKLSLQRVPAPEKMATEIVLPALSPPLETVATENRAKTTKTLPLAAKILVSIAAVASVNYDDTITMELAGPFWSGLAEARRNPAEAAELNSLSLAKPTSTLINVKDGEVFSIAIRVLEFPPPKNFKGVPFLNGSVLLGGAVPSPKSENPSDIWLFFVTARIIRRVEDPVPGT